MKLTVDRKTWLRGEGSGPSKLLREADQKMCCLGFLGLQCGLNKEDIRGRATPFTTVFTSAWPKELWGSYTLTYDLMRVNDAIIGMNVLGDPEFVPLQDEADREARLTELFKQAGVEVEFVG